jgi:hypothetical protein
MLIFMIKSGLFPGAGPIMLLRRSCGEGEYNHMIVTGSSKYSNVVIYTSSSKTKYVVSVSKMETKQCIHNKYTTI